MASICLYFKIHEPIRLSQYSQLIGSGKYRFENVAANVSLLNRLAEECYLPANKIMLEQLQANKGDFKINLSISGIMLQLLREYRPDVIESFRLLLTTGCVEILAETHYHSLSSLYSQKEFRRQIILHQQEINELFGQTPVVFRNTELIHNNSIGNTIASMGLKGILCEGSGRILNGRTVNQIYKATDSSLPLLLRNARLSDDIAFRFDDANWSEHPLTARKFSEWISNHPDNDEVINLFMDYETFGLHKHKDSGIFDFLSQLPGEVLENTDFKFSTASEAIEQYQARETYDVRRTISWDDKNRECCVICENVLQNNMLKKIYSLEKMVIQNPDDQWLHLWGLLQTADYFYYMTDSRCRNNNHSYLNPFGSAQEAHRVYAAIVTDFELMLIQKSLSTLNYSHYDAPAGMLY